MTISLANNLFANTGTAAKQSAASKKTQTAGQAEDKSSPFASELDGSTQALAQKKSVDESANDFSATLAKKTEPKKTSKKNDADDNQQEKDENTENTENSAVPQELLAIPVAQNINIDTNTDVVPEEQLATTDDSVRITADIVQTPAVSQTVSKTNIQEIAAPTDEQTQATEQSISEIISDNLQTAVTDETAVCESENKNEIELTSTAVENLTDISDQTQTEESEDTKPQLTIEELAGSQDLTNVEMPELEIPVVAATVQNQQAFSGEIDSKDDSDSDINIDVESDTTLKDILSEIQNTIPDSAKNNNTNSISSDSVSDDKFSPDDFSVKSVEPDKNSSQQSPDIQDSTIEAKTSDSNNSDSILTSLQSLVTDDSQIFKTSSVAENTHKLNNADSTTSVAGQIQYNIQSSLSADNREIVIQLNPPELGKVEIKFTEDSTGLTGVLSVDKPHTRYEIQQSLPEIIQNLKDGGVDIKKIEVVLANQQEHQDMKDHSSAGQNNWSWQQNSSNQQNNTGGNIYSRWGSKGTESYNPYSTPDMHYSEDSVNMLV
ncbi:MAG: flagellar hook-length control protein FliK [Planctomycetaceae bacterium]|nr:flagellar hook-length control protein FliK [Planctomycetaceae bacterium]